MSGDTETGVADWHDDEVGSAGLPMIRTVLIIGKYAP